MRAIRFDGQGVSLDARAPEPSPEPGEAIIRPVRMGIGSADLARARLAGTPAITLGHEFVGIVERVHGDGSGAERKRWEKKRVVGSINVVCGACDLCRAGLSSHCRRRAVLGLRGRDGCFAERFALPVRNLTEVPAGVDDDAACLAQSVAAALHAAHLVRLEGKPYVTILGDGAVGLIAAQVMARRNASVRLLGMHARNYTLCEKWGIKHRHVDEPGRRQDQDVVFDCTGDGSGLALAMRLVRPKGVIVTRSTPLPCRLDAGGSGSAASGSRVGGVPLVPELASIALDELTVLGARCGSVADAVTALARGEIDTAALITRRAKLQDGVGALRAAGEAEQIKVVMEV